MKSPVESTPPGFFCARCRVLKRIIFESNPPQPAMSTQVLEKLNRLPAAQQQEVLDFADFLASRYGRNSDKVSEEVEGDEDIQRLRRENMGWAKGKIWVAPDFDETPEDFKDYL